MYVDERKMADACLLNIVYTDMQTCLSLAIVPSFEYIELEGAPITMRVTAMGACGCMN